jgi:hypothetical protein
VCNNTHAVIRKYGLMVCRQCFREYAKDIGFIKVRRPSSPLAPLGAPIVATLVIQTAPPLDDLCLVHRIRSLLGSCPARVTGRFSRAVIRSLNVMLVRLQYR